MAVIERTPESRPPVGVLAAEEISASNVERVQQLADTVRAVEIISGLTGKELSATGVDDYTQVGRQPGVYVLSPHVASAEGITDTRFELDELLLSGKADSAHSVVTGELEIDFKGDPSQSIPIVAKRAAKREFDDRFQRILREVEVLEKLQALGEPAFEPIAVVVAPVQHPLVGEVVLVTRFAPEILSLDNQPWGRGADNEANKESAIAAATALGHFNAVIGYCHGDAKIKNAAVEEGNGYGMIDFETSAPFDASNPAEVMETVNIDFSLFIDSLYKRRYFTGLNTKGRVESALEMLTYGYLAPWEDSAPEVQDAAVNEATSVCDRFVQQMFNQ